MEALTTIAFLALVAGIPTLVIGVALYRLTRWALLHAVWKRTLAERGWSVGEDESVVRAALDDAGLPTRRAWLTWLAEKDGSFIARYHHRARRSNTRRVLVVPRPTKGPLGTIQPRADGLLESAALKAVDLASGSDAVGAPGDFDGWEWALVLARGEPWLDASASPPLRAFLLDGEMLAFGSDHVVLALADGEVHELFERREGLLDALRGASES